MANKPVSEDLKSQLNRAVSRIETADREISDLKTTLSKTRETILKQKSLIDKLTAEPLAYASVMQVHDEINPKFFLKNDAVLITKRGDSNYNKIGILNTNLDEEGHGTVCFYDVNEDGETIIVDTRNYFFLISEDCFPEARLLDKSDGSHCVVSCDKTIYRLRGEPELKLIPGDTVVVCLASKQVVDKASHPAHGSIVNVVNVHDNTSVEIEEGGNRRIVTKNVGIELLESGDRVVLCSGGHVILRKLNRESDAEFNLKSDISTSWNEIAGLGDAKKRLFKSIIMPSKHPEIIAFYNRKPSKGFLFFGPPGCGKTLLGKAVATEFASLHGKESMNSGFIYVKGPEILTMWVGESERKVRELFLRGEKHYEKNKYPAILFIDEADAILSERGTSVSSDVDKTIVPMFLSLMDGLTDNNVIVILATNRAAHLDPAVIRDGRCDEHIKISRPDVNTTPDYFNIHLKGIPLNGISANEVAVIATQWIFSGKLIYNIHAKEGMKLEFCLKDCLNGAMVSSVIRKAVDVALERDLENNTQEGVRLEDFQIAVNDMYDEQFGLNHRFDLEDFADVHGFDIKSASLKKTAK